MLFKNRFISEELPTLDDLVFWDERVVAWLPCACFRLVALRIPRLDENVRTPERWIRDRSCSLGRSASLVDVGRCSPSCFGTGAPSRNAVHPAVESQLVRSRPLAARTGPAIRYKIPINISADKTIFIGIVFFVKPIAVICCWMRS